MKNVSVVILILSLLGCSEAKNKKSKPYQAGFKIVQTKDESRIYKPDTDTTDYLYHRPLDIDVWYPANVTAQDTTILFRDILRLLENRANYYTASEAGNGLTELVAQSFCEAFQCSSPEKLLNFRTNSYKDANPVDSKFPLVIYLASFNSMSYENFTLFERLASRGYVVASISSIGRYPGDMTMKNDDMIQQVYDAIASVKKLKGSPNIDFSKIGVIGYSWGGLSGTILASKMTNIACLVSLDGSEFHQYGQNQKEDADFDGITNSDDFKEMSLSVPYFRLESSPMAQPSEKDSVYDFSEKLSSDKFILKVDSANHQDFSCLPTFVRSSGNCERDYIYDTISKLTISYLDSHLRESHSFFELVEEEMNKTIRK